MIGMECVGKTESDMLVENESERAESENRRAKSKGPIEGRVKQTFYRNMPAKERPCNGAPNVSLYTDVLLPVGAACTS